MKTHTYQIGDNIVGTGTTKTAARAAAESAAAAWASGDYEPDIISAHGWVGVVYREPDGFRYRIYYQDGAGMVRPFLSYPAEIRGGWDNANAACRYHIAQCIGDDRGFDVLQRRDAINEFGSWVEFQRRYRALIVAGYPHDAAHAAAGKAPHLTPEEISAADAICG